jgi:type III secretory pathway component EscT
MKATKLPKRVLLGTLIGICLFIPFATAETADEWNEKGINYVESTEMKKQLNASIKQSS